VTYGENEELNLNINSSPHRCNISYIPQHVLEHGGEGDYFCRIPFSVGKRAIDSLDLMNELPKLGLPQFCRPISRKGEVFMLQENLAEVATTVDVECAAIGRDASGRAVLSFRLNHYATDLVTEVAATESPITTHIRGSADQPLQIVRDAGRILFTYPLNSEPRRAEAQRKVIVEEIGLKSSCP
jgi:hypothetical protein